MNPVLLIFLLPTLTAIGRTLVAGAKNTLEGRYNKTLGYVLIGVAVYLFIRSVNNARQTTYADQAGTDPAGQLAVRLRQAFNPSGTPYLINFDGTSTAEVMTIAGQIKNYSDVANYYRTLYNSDLTTDLQNELSVNELKEFWSIVYRTTPGGGSNPPVVVRNPNVGKLVTTRAQVNVRNITTPYAVVRRAEAGQSVGYYESERTIGNIAGVTGSNVFVVVTVPSWFGLVTDRYLVLKNAVTIAQ